MANDFDRPINIDLVGQRCIGRTSLIERLVTNSYSECEIDLSSRTQTCQSCTVVLDKKKYELSINEIEGHYARERRIDAVILVYDTTDKSSLVKLADDMKTKEFLKKKSWEPQLFLLGTKNDLINKVQVDEEMVKNFITEQDSAGKQIIYLGTTSAKTGENVKEVFNKIISSFPLMRRPCTTKRAYSKYEIYEEDQPSEIAAESQQNSKTDGAIAISENINTFVYNQIKRLDHFYIWNGRRKAELLKNALENFNSDGASDVELKYKNSGLKEALSTPRITLFSCCCQPVDPESLKSFENEFKFQKT